MSTSLLLADDSETIAKILKMALQSEPYEIKSVLTADDALKELKANPPFFFLVDLTLPGKNGYEFAKIIRADSKLNKIRIVLLSSAFDPADPAKVEECGADMVIVKPFDPSDLRAKLRQVSVAAPKFPAGSNVSGTLSGEKVEGKPAAMAAKLTEESMPKAEAEPSLTTTPSLNLDSATFSSADDILSDLLGQEKSSAKIDVPDFTGSILLKQPTIVNPEQVPIQDAHADIFSDKKETTKQTNATVAIEAGSLGLYQAPPDTVLDLSGNFQTPAGGTAMIEFPPEDKNSITTLKAQVAAPLSSNAEALAAFFEAEISLQEIISAPEEEKAPTPFEPTPSFASIDDNSVFDEEDVPKESLKSWSGTSAGNKKQPDSPSAAPRSAQRSSGGGSPSLLFDTGESTFQFSADYVQRITKAFTGDLNEPVPDPNASKISVFPHASDDRKSPAAANPPSAPGTRLGGGAWSEEEVKKVEQLVREEVQMMVREVVEKVAWEVIPELAENLIKKELEKVMKDLES